MAKFLNLLNINKFKTHLMIFILMIIAPIGMYAASMTGGVIWIWIFLGVAISANLLAILTK